VRPAWVVAGAGAASVTALGGGADEGGAPAAKRTPARSPATTLPAELKGSWTRRFRRGEVEAEGSAAGLYTLRIGDGIADVYEGPEADQPRDCVTQERCFEVTLEGSGRVLTVGETPICTGTGRYSFTVKGDSLTTRKVHDDCTGRPVLFGGCTWRRAR
jgi:hypothetical protein